VGYLVNDAYSLYLGAGPHPRTLMAGEAATLRSSVGLGPEWSTEITVEEREPLQLEVDLREGDVVLLEARRR